MKTELRIVFLAKNGRPFITESDVIAYEQNKSKNSRGKRMTIISLIQKLLEDKNWGVYYKSKPLQNLQVQDGVPLLRVNDVSIETICQEADKILNELEERDDKWKEQRPSQKDSQQEKS